MTIMEENFDIQSYMTQGVERVVADAVKATLKNPKESAYMARFAFASKKASKKRRKAEDKGEHIPPFLIASITSQCNLHCAGCYSRCNHATTDAEPVKQLTGEEWSRIFDEADELGISFILLAGGEPLLRYDVITEAAGRPDILFPIFTNGTYMNERFYDMFDRNRNLIPIISIEGEKEVTDKRRGEGVYDRLIEVMDELKKRGIIFGVSVTVTTQNLKEVSSPILLIHSKEDDLTSIKSSEIVNRKISSTDKEYIILYDSYHMVLYDNEKEFVFNKALEFLDNHIKSEVCEKELVCI